MILKTLKHFIFAILALMVVGAHQIIMGQEQQLTRRINYTVTDNIPAPIRINNLSVEGMDVEVNKDFQAMNEDWLKNIKLQILNSSEKVITHIHISLLLHHKNNNAVISQTNTGVNGSHFPFAGAAVPFVVFGKDNKVSNVTSAAKLLPGERLTVLSEDIENKMLPRILDWSNLSLKDVTGVSIMIRSIVFEDKTSWLPGKYLDKPVSNPK